MPLLTFNSGINSFFLFLFLGFLLKDCILHDINTICFSSDTAWDSISLRNEMCITCIYIIHCFKTYKPFFHFLFIVFYLFLCFFAFFVVICVWKFNKLLFYFLVLSFSWFCSFIFCLHNKALFYINIPYLCNHILCL